jgi:hypothetical protein
MAVGKVGFANPPGRGLCSAFLRDLFPDDPNPTDKHGRKKKQLTAGGQIRDQVWLWRPARHGASVGADVE